MTFLIDGGGGVDGGNDGGGGDDDDDDDDDEKEEEEAWVAFVRPNTFPNNVQKRIYNRCQRHETRNDYGQHVFN